MSQLRTAKPVDLGAFPGCTFVVENTPPNTQCQEAQFTIPGATWPPASGSVITAAIPSFDDQYVVGKKITITGTVADDGTYDILAQNSTQLTINYTFAGADGGNTCIVHDTGQAYLTRDERSFAMFIHEEPGAYTFKAGKLYTSLASPPLNAACSDTWNPA